MHFSIIIKAVTLPAKNYIQNKNGTNILKIYVISIQIKTKQIAANAMHHRLRTSISFPLVFHSIAFPHIFQHL
jgi:hypothetical protein